MTILKYRLGGVKNNSEKLFGEALNVRRFKQKRTKIKQVIVAQNRANLLCSLLKALLLTH